MSIERKLTPDELKLGILLRDPLLFPSFLWKADLTIPHNRADLPKEWCGKQLLSKEQKLMFCDVSRKVLFCTARKIAKTLLIERDVIQLGLMNDRRDGGLDEAMFFTPGDAHMSPVRSRIFSKMLGVPLFKLFLDKKPSAGEGGAGTLQFKTGLKWHFRIEGVSGTDANMAGIRAKYILGDELAFGSYICHNSRGQTALPDARWKYCGVPNGIRDTPFYALDQTSLGDSWSRHKYTSAANPLYKSEKAWKELIEFYGGVNTQGFINQCLGEWGSEMFSSFPPGSIAVKELPFTYLELTNKEIRQDVLDDPYLARLIGLPTGVGQGGIYQAILGWDYGFSPDPCVMTIFYRTGSDSQDWYELMRLRMMRIPRPRQARIVEFINDRLLGNKLVGIVSDDSGCVQIMQTDPKFGPKFKDRMTWANTSGTVTRLDEFGQPMIDESGKPINVRRKEWSNEEFRSSMQYALLRIPNPFYMWLAEGDETLIAELAGTIERRKASGYIEYMAPNHTPGSTSQEDHASDSCRFAAMAIQNAMAPKQEEDTSWQAYAEVLGWTDKNVAAIPGWRVPWST